MKTRIRKNERVLNLLAYLLRMRLPVTFAEARQRVNGYDDFDTAEATVARRFERDKDMLRALGVEIAYAEDPLTGVKGYSLVKSSAFLGDLDLDEEETRLLAVLAALARTRDTALAANLSSACHKLLALSAQPDAAVAGSGRQLVHTKSTVSDKALAYNLQQSALALEKRQRVLFTYYGIYRDETSDRTVEPYGLKFYRGEWYMVGRCLQRRDVRTFRLDRMRGRVRTLAGDGPNQYEIPAGFSTNDFVGRSPWQLSKGSATRAAVELDEIGAWLVREARPAGLRLGVKGSRVTGSVAVRNDDAFFKWLFSLGKHVRLVYPPEMVLRFVTFLEGLMPDGKREF